MTALQGIVPFIGFSLAIHLAAAVLASAWRDAVRIEHSAGGASIVFAADYDADRSQAATKEVVSREKQADRTDPRDEEPEPNNVERVEVEKRPNVERETPSPPPQESREALIKGSQQLAKQKTQQRIGSAGQGQRTPGNASMSNYKGRVVARIRAKRRYPAAARRQRLQGTAVVSFVIAKSGAASGVRLVRSSGHTALDNEAVAIVSRAAPFPPLPTTYSGGRMALSIPIAFRMR